MAPEPRLPENSKLFNLIASAIFIAILLTWWVGSSFMEALAFNRLTGRNATTWDAMWIDLGRHLK